MIEYQDGNLLDADVDALVNPVNCEGVMGAGLAKQFRETYPRYYQDYKRLCEEGYMKVGMPLLHRVDGERRLLISLPTKDRWRNPSQMTYITEGLRELRELIERGLVQSVAIPALGCGHGGLDWEAVRPEIENHLGDLECQVIVYPPREDSDAPN